MTLVEMLVAMAILVIVMAAIVPQIRAIRGSWDSKAKNVEAIHNGRVLVDHITSQLSQATQIAAVSDSNETNGYIEFLNNDGNTMRYEIDASNYVVYGPVGSLSELAGPVSQLAFTCYDACDLDTPITDVNLIRTVKVQTTMTNSAAMGRDQMFSGQAYLRTNFTPADSNDLIVREISSSEHTFDSKRGSDPTLCQIDATHYLCTYGGFGSDGYAVILVVDANNWTITHGTPLEFDTSSCIFSDLARIDATNYLCVYEGPGSDGWSVILTVNTITDDVTMGTPFEFDTSKALEPRVSQIDDDDFLCVYVGPGPGTTKYGTAVVLTVDTVMGTITGGTPFVFETNNVDHIATANIDNVHHLCVAYTAKATDPDRAYVLTANAVTKTVTKESEVDASAGWREPAVCKIDDNHYLVVCFGMPEKKARIVTVDTGTWAITEGTIYEFGADGFYSDVAWISSDYYLWVYGGFNHEGELRVLKVDTQADTIECVDFYAYTHGSKAATPELAKVDDTHFLDAFERTDGMAIILEVSSSTPVLP
jgi:type II secretory pathway pseudopilin PulG